MLLRRRRVKFEWKAPLPRLPHCRLAMYLRTGDQVVDFSCGENAFVPLVKKRCLRCVQSIDC